MSDQAPTSEIFETSGPAQTIELGRRLAERFGAGDCVALVGDLGTGKTTLVRGIAIGLGLQDPRLVSSPSYVLVQEYLGRVPVYHVDLYRLPNPSEEVGQLGLDEMLGEGVVLIEWADRASDALPLPRWELVGEVTGARRRRFTLRRLG
jgi:tRNA threonylcarbamoyladenosine biosynthesis protein TsaE